MKAKTVETFASIQGEGKYAGIKQVFVRFFECNMHCVWCDTPHSIGDTTQKFDQWSIEELFYQIETLWKDCHSVSLTGGEPLMQVDVIKELLKKMRSVKMLSYLETNGTLPEALDKIIDEVDVIAMDLKLPSSTQCQSYWQEHEEFIKIAKKKDLFIKTVISSDTKQEDVEKSIEIVTKIDPNILFILQPNFFDMQNGVVKKCQEFHKLCVEQLADVRIIPQMHKMMKLR